MFYFHPASNRILSDCNTWRLDVQFPVKKSFGKGVDNRSDLHVSLPEMIKNGCECCGFSERIVKLPGKILTCQFFYPHLLWSSHFVEWFKPCLQYCIHPFTFTPVFLQFLEMLLAFPNTETKKKSTYVRPYMQTTRPWPSIKLAKAYYIAQSDWCFINRNVIDTM